MRDVNREPMQNAVSTFLDRHALRMGVVDRMLDLTSEVGELAKETLMGTDYGRRPFQLPEGFAGEFGDALFCLLALADEAGISAESSLAGAIAKYEARVRAAGDPGSGSHPPVA